MTLVLRHVDQSVLVARSLVRNRMLQLVESRFWLSGRNANEVAGTREFKGKAGSLHGPQNIFIRG